MTKDIIVTGSSDKTVKVWNLDQISKSSNFTQNLIFHSEEVLDVNISWISGLIASASDDKKAAIWDLRSPEKPINILYASND